MTSPRHPRKPPLHVVTWFYDYQPGLAIYVQRLALLREHYELHLIVRHPSHAARLGCADAAHVHVIAVSDASYWGIVRYCLKVIAHLGRRAPAPVFLFASHLSMAAIGLRRQPTAIYWNEMPSHYFSTHAGWSIKGLFTAAFRALTYVGARAASVVMPISRFMADDLERRGAQASRVQVVDMGVAMDGVPGADLPRPTPQPAPQPDADHITVCYAGTLTDERGRSRIVGGVLRALSGGLPVRLLLIGVPEADQPALRAAFNAAGFPDALELRGLVTSAEVFEAYARADLGVTLLEPNEHFQFNPPTKLFEYLVAGLPVICNRIRTLTHYVEDGRTGFYCDYTVAGVADAIARAAADRPALAAMRAQCIAAGERYRWERVAPQFLQQMQRLYLAPSGRPATDEPARAVEARD